MDIKTIEHIDLLLERYFNAETTLEEEARLRAFFCSDDVPARLEQWRNLFVVADDEVLGDDFDSRILAMIDGESHKPAVKARVISMRSRLMPLFKAAAVVAIILTLGGALQAPFDSSWQTPDDYAALPQPLDSVAVVSPIQAENISEVAVDSTLNMKH